MIEIFLEYYNYFFNMLYLGDIFIIVYCVYYKYFDIVNKILFWNFIF